MKVSKCAIGWLVASLWCINAASQINKVEKEALLQIYESCGGENWKIKWNIEKPVSSWYGVRIEEGRVVSLELFHNNLSGTIPKEIGKLKYLRSLNLAFNNLTGKLPSEIGALENLEILELHMNQLKGQIPEQIGNLHNLRKWNAYNNRLFGQIPNSLGQLQNLEELNLSSNNLNGEIPKSIGALKKLKKLGLFENQLNGSIPVTISSLTKMEELVLANNALSGEVPDLGVMEQLQIVQIQNNNFQSYDGLQNIKSNGLAAFDTDEPKEHKKFKNFDAVKTRMADTKFDDKEDNE